MTFSRTTPVPGEIKVARDPLKAFQQGFIAGQTTTYCEQIKTGAKLIAEIPCKEEHRDLISQMVASDGCKVLFRGEPGAEWGAGRIYKYKLAECLLTHPDKRISNTSPTAHEIWAEGKRFGYSDCEIARYLHRCGYIPSWP